MSTTISDLLDNSTSELYVSTISDVIDVVEEVTEQAIRKLATEYQPEQLGLDKRCYSVLVDSEFSCIIVEGSTGAINYYGGFEYIEDEYISRIGNYTIYHEDSDRVRDHLDRLQESLEEQAS